MTVKVDGTLSYRSVSKGVKSNEIGNISIIVLFCFLTTLLQWEESVASDVRTVGEYRPWPDSRYYPDIYM
jgi:hypothetical protein